MFLTGQHNMTKRTHHLNNLCLAKKRLLKYVLYQRQCGIVNKMELFCYIRTSTMKLLYVLVYEAIEILTNFTLNGSSSVVSTQNRKALRNGVFIFIECTSQRPPFRHKPWQLLFPVELMIFNTINRQQCTETRTHSGAKILADEFLYYFITRGCSGLKTALL